jgi:hypothetical protein
MAIKRRKLPSVEELIRTFVRHQGGRLLYVGGQWWEASGSGWVKIPNRKVNRLLRNAGWNSRIVTSGRHVMERPPSTFVHSGPLPAISVEPLAASSATPATDAFMMRHAGRLIFYHGSNWWMRWSGNNWLPIYDREVNRLIREVSPLGVVKMRRDLERHVAFAVPDGAFELSARAVKEMVS